MRILSQAGYVTITLAVIIGNLNLSIRHTTALNGAALTQHIWLYAANTSDGAEY